MTVSIAVNGREIGQVSVKNLGPTSPEERDPGGERRYQVRRWKPKPFTAAEVVHRRGDGAEVLASKALAALNEETMSGTTTGDDSG